jgi:hypothetical protein
MGLDFNAVKILFWARNLGVSFERTLTLGRQSLVCSTGRMYRATRDFGLPGSREDIERCLHRPSMQMLYADEFLRFLGANEPVSVDYSDFEGATLLHDLNRPFPENERGRYTLVIDGGTLEHIFNYPAALRHCLELLCPGGHFLSMTPAHNQMGHGFYQFSPELFFRVFSPENGFALRKIVLYDPMKVDSRFYQVNDPAVTGYRNRLVSNKTMSLAVLAQRLANTPILGSNPMQSDYVSVWEQSRQLAAAATSSPGFIRRLRIRLNPYWPHWLRRIKATLVYLREYGHARLTNRRDYHLLSRKEIFRERARPEAADPVAVLR